MRGSLDDAVRWVNTATSPGNEWGKGARNGGAVCSRPKRQPSTVNRPRSGHWCAPISTQGADEVASVCATVDLARHPSRFDDHRTPELAHARTRPRGWSWPTSTKFPRGSMTSVLKALAMRSSRRPPPRSDNVGARDTVVGKDLAGGAYPRGSSW